MVGSLVDGFHNFVNIVGNLGDQHDISAACDTGVQRQPANLMAHNLNNEYTVVGSCRRVDAVDGICGNIHSALETKGHIGPVNIIINGLRQMNDVQPLFTEKVCRLLCAVSAKDDKTVQTELVIILFHRFNLIQAVFIGHPHKFKGLTGRPKDGASFCQNTGKIFGREHTVIAVDQTLVSVHEAVHFQFVKAVAEALHNTSHCSI